MSQLEHDVQRMHEYLSPHNTEYRSLYDSAKLNKYNVPRKKRVKTPRGDKITYQEETKINPLEHTQYRKDLSGQEKASKISAQTLKVQPSQNITVNKLTMHRFQPQLQDHGLFQFHASYASQRISGEKINPCLYTVKGDISTDHGQQLTESLQTLYSNILPRVIKADLPEQNERI